ncbi:MAG: hypothetical protein KDN18_04180 [Verrucomicrobiae bacterium]|nr:hypothetical protein [Verrucomicrobiae bacterium]
MKFRISFLPLALFAGLFLSGCAGYRLGEVKPGTYMGIEKIHVPPFRNLTLEPRLSSLVTNAVLAGLQSDGTFKVATRNNCDAVLVGTIREIRKRQLRAVRTDTLRSRELSLFIYVEFHLEDPVTGARIGKRGYDEDGDGSDDESDNVSEGPDGKSDDSFVYGARQGLVVGETIQFVDASYQVGERNAFSVAAQDAADKIVSQLANGW